MRGPTAENLTLTCQDVRTEVMACLKTYLPLTAEGYCVTTEVLLDVLLHAAATGTSVEAACDTLLEAADANTVRSYLNQQLTVEGLPMLEHRLNQALGSDLPRRIRRAKLDIACDTHDQPFYGKSPELVALSRRGEARAGTTHFFRIATVYAMHRGVRITLGVVFMRPDDRLADTLALLIHRIRSLGLSIGRLWLDRGFASVEIFDYLRRDRLAAVVACPIRGKTGGTRALCHGRASYSTTHSFHRPDFGYCHVRMAVVPLRRDPAKPVEWMIFALIGGDLTPQQVRDQYRRRFGIESSYRQLRQVRIRTNTRNPALRFIYMALALLLTNIWCLLRFRYCQLPGRGCTGRPVDPRRLKLRHLALFLRLAIERHRGVFDSIQAHLLPLQAESVVH